MSGGILAKIATFFNEWQIDKLIQDNDVTQAHAAWDHFSSNFSHEDARLEQLLALADLAFIVGAHERSLSMLETAKMLDSRRVEIYHKIGRVYLHRGDMSAAAEELLRGTEVDPFFPFNWLWLTRIESTRGNNGAAAEYATKFAALGADPYTSDDMRLLERVAGHVFMHVSRDQSLPLYEYFFARNPTAHITTRLAEACIALGDHNRAVTLLNGPYALGQLDKWGRAALADSYLRVDPKRAAEVAKELIVEDPATAPENALAIYFEASLRADGKTIEEALTDHRLEFSDVQRNRLRLRDLQIRQDFDGISALVGPWVIPPHGQIYYALIEAAYGALGQGRLATVEALLHKVKEADRDHITVKLLETDLSFRQQNWDRADAALRSITDDEGRPEILLKRFELACFRSDRDLSRTLRLQLDAIVPLPSSFMAPVLRSLAEDRLWSDIVERTIPWLSHEFSYPQIGYVIFRAVSKTGGHSDVLKAIEAVANWRGSADLAKLHMIISYDMARRHDELPRLIEESKGQADTLLAKKLRMEASGGVARRGRNAIFLCSDRNYICSTMVALESVMTACEGYDCDFFVVADQEALDEVRDTAKAMAVNGVEPILVPVEPLIPSPEKLSADYGLFTSGHVLSSAAFYRIYFAHHLAKGGMYDRGVYVDSDTVIRPRFVELLTMPMNGDPIAARREPLRAEVLAATRAHDLTEGTYFNSGVLLFDFTNPGAMTGLDGSIAAIGGDAVLIYHDQCALNRGFRGLSMSLDEHFNYPVSEEKTIAELPDEAAILHFLDRPKPWSVAYAGPCALLWYDQWQRLAGKIGGDDAKRLMRIHAE
jgi:lipopolysaccharide biosynthesis glycosyltransferase/tetratricopeptide (TPR) repeat protein